MKQDGNLCGLGKLSITNAATTHPPCFPLYLKTEKSKHTNCLTAYLQRKTLVNLIALSAALQTRCLDTGGGGSVFGAAAPWCSPVLPVVTSRRPGRAARSRFCISDASRQERCSSTARSLGLGKCCRAKPVGAAGVWITSPDPLSTAASLGWQSQAAAWHKWKKGGLHGWRTRAIPMGSRRHMSCHAFRP